MEGSRSWEYLDANPGVADAFHHAMAAATALTVRALPAAMRLERFRRVADIGGGSGLVLAEILRAAPHVTGILFDRAEAIEAGRQRFSAEGLSGRVTLETGDLLTHVPTGRRCVHPEEHPPRSHSGELRSDSRCAARGDVTRGPSVRHRSRPAGRRGTAPGGLARSAHDGGSGRSRTNRS
jgi:O-methyltransferase domain